MPSSIAVLAYKPFGRDDPVGVATPVSSQLLLTCVHVLRAAGYPRQEGIGIRIRIDEQPEPRIVFASLLKCPWADGGDQWPTDEKLPPRLDVVALRLPEAMTGGVPAPRALDHSDAGAEMTAFGFPSDAPSGRQAGFKVAAMVDTRGLRQLNWKEGELPVDLGYSGGPVWDTKGAIVGMIVLRWRPDDTDHHSPPLGYMVPITAVSELFKRHVVSGLSVEPAILAKYKSARTLVDWTQDRLAENPYHKKRTTTLLPPTFAAGKVGQAPAEVLANIERLHSGEDDALVAFDQLGPAELSSGSDHYYIQAPGGAGKSFALYELVAASVASGTLPVLITAIEGGTAIEEALQRTSVDAKLDALFYACKSQVGFKFFQQAIKNDDPVLLIIDGLNEVPADADEIITLAGNTVANFGNVRVVIVDRMTLRREYPDVFRLATIAPLSLDIVRTAIPEFPTFDPDFQRLLRSPFFLDLFRESSDATLGKRTRTRILLAYIEWLLKDQQGVEHQVEEASRVLAEVAFEAYRAGGQNLTAEMFKKASGSFKLDPQLLTDSGLLRKNATPSSSFVFRHQLIHDCLASRYFIQERMVADTENLNILTLNRRSWDSLVLALEDSDSTRADELLIDIYDWDHGITLSCLVETRNDPNDALATAICAVLSEKLEDTFLHTRRRTQERVWALKRFLSTDGELSPAKTLEQIRGQEERFADKPLHQWWLVFTAEAATPELWSALVGTDPLAGWTAASALRRILLQTDESESKAILERLIIVYDALRNQARTREAGPIRWRIVHVMGRFKFATSQLMKIGFDSDENDDIRYGAFRELVEVAATTPEQEALQILNTIEATIDTASLSNRALSALRSCAILKERSSEEPRWWRDAYRPLLSKAMLLVQKSGEDYAMWEAQKERFDADERQKSI